MSVLVLVEHSGGVFKKKSLEAIQYAANIAKGLSTTVTAVAVGSADDAAMAALGQYGAQKVLHTTDGRLDNFGWDQMKTVAAKLLPHLDCGGG